MLFRIITYFLYIRLNFTFFIIRVKCPLDEKKLFSLKDKASDLDRIHNFSKHNVDIGMEIYYYFNTLAVVMYVLFSK